MNKPNVLLIDDSPVMGQFLSLFLSSKYEVTACLSQKEVLKLLKSGYQPAVIISDFEMPGLEGSVWINTIKKQCPKAEVFIISAHKGSKERIAALKAGASDYLPKPFHPAEVDLRIQKLLAASKFTARGTSSNVHQPAFSLAL